MSTTARPRRTDRTRAGSPPVGAPRGWTARLPVAFIVLALLGLLLVPAWLQQRIAQVRDVRIDVLQPAEDLVSVIQLSLAREMGALRGFVITDDPSFLDRYEQALERERQAYRSLSPLIERQGPAIRTAYANLRASSSRWHGRVTEAEILARRLVPDEFIRRIPSEEARYEQTLRAAEALRGTILREVERNRRRVEAIGRVGLRLNLVLVVFALVAAAIALRLDRRLRSFAVEAERGRAEVERILDDRERLVRGITHDLKNPLGAADGHAQLLESGVRGELEAEQRESVGRIRSSLGSALGIIDDLLELSRAESGELPIKRAPTDVAAVARGTVEDQRADAQAAGIELDLRLPERAPTVVTDADRVREILRNLISNGVKYSREGDRVAVAVGVRRDRAAPAPGQWLAIDVSDTGPGIPPEDRERIFEEFARLDRPGAVRDRREGAAADDGERDRRRADAQDEPSPAGTGLGLAISRRVARALGGDITVVSEVGRGSTFTLWLPIEAEPAPGAGRRRSPNATGH
ncbi:MAG: ATP-binding protein [Gemmatimonadota bacterium]